MKIQESKRALQQPATSQWAGKLDSAVVEQMPTDETQAGKDRALKTLGALLETLEARMRSRNARVSDR